MDEQEFINDTELIEEPFGRSHFDSYFVFSIILMIVCSILYIVSASAECFLVCTICRFKRLKTRTNMYILNCCIWNILAYVISPFSYFMDHCVFLRTRNTFIALSIIFAFALAVDWFTSCCKPNWMTVYHKYYKYVFLTIYIAMFVESCISIYICKYESSYDIIYLGTRDLYLSILYAMSLIPLLIINCFKKKVCTRPDSFKTAYALTTSNIIILSLLPLFLLFILESACRHLFEYNFIFILISTIIEFVAVCFYFGYPLLMVYMLGKQSTHFKMSYDQSFKRNTGNYGDDIVDAEYCAGDDSVQVK